MFNVIGTLVATGCHLSMAYSKKVMISVESLHFDTINVNLLAEAASFCLSLEEEGKILDGRASYLIDNVFRSEDGKDLSHIVIPQMERLRDGKR